MKLLNFLLSTLFRTACILYIGFAVIWSFELIMNWYVAPMPLAYYQSQGIIK